MQLEEKAFPDTAQHTAWLKGKHVASLPDNHRRRSYLPLLFRKRHKLHVVHGLAPTKLERSLNRELSGGRPGSLY